MRSHAEAAGPLAATLLLALGMPMVWALPAAVLAPNWSAPNLSPAPSVQPLELDVVINGTPIGKIGDFEQNGSTLRATRHELEELGLRPEPGAPDQTVPLDRLDGTTYRVDRQTQTVYIAAPPRALKPAQLAPARVGTALAPLETTFGAVLDYDVVSTYAGERLSADGVFDARMFSAWGVLSSGVLARAGLSAARAGFTRLDTTYTYSDPDTMRRVRVGDVIASGLAWTRPVRLGGAQFARDFALRPDLVTFPVPSIAGQVAVPSTVDVLVNGVQQFSAAAGPGPFEVKQLPVVNGVNDIALVVDNAVGRQVAQTLPVYASSVLLATGLDAYSAEIGAVRLGYGVRGDDYRTLAGSASYRRGITDRLSLSAHAEGTPSLAMAGGGASLSLGRWGVASAAVAGSAARGRRALLGYAAYERITPDLSLSASVQWADAGFRDLAALYGDGTPRTQVRAGVGLPVGRGTLAASYTRLRRTVSGAGYGSPAGFAPGAPGLFTPLAASFLLPVRVSLISASYSAPVFNGRALLYATAFDDLDNRRNVGVLFGVTLPLGARSSATLNAGLDAGQPAGGLQATRSTVEVGDVGGQAVLTEGRTPRQLALAEYKSPWGLADFGVDRVGHHTALRAGATGAVVLAGGDVFASNPIPDSFAVVDTGAPGVTVLSENRPVQRSPASGKVLVPDLRSYENNRIGIDPADLPLDMEYGPTLRTVRPQDRSGVFVQFAVRRNASALLRLVDEAGRPVPVGATVHVEPDGDPAAVGYDGEAFLHALPPSGRVDVALPGGAHCRATFSYQPQPGAIPTIGPLRCRADAS